MTRGLAATQAPAQARSAPSNKTWWLTAAVMLLTSTGLWWARPHTPPGNQPSDAAGLRFPWNKADTQTASAAIAATPHFKTGLEQLPRSLVGTSVDGQLEADAAGHLKLTRGVRDLFDYFLSLIGEEPLLTVRARLLAYIHAHLPPTAAAEAAALLDHYLAYKTAEGQAAQQAGGNANALTLDAVTQRFDTLQTLRTQYFSVAEREAFFADDEALDRYTVARLKVLQDTSLSPADKARRINELTANLPPALRASLSVADTVQTLDALTADWKARGGSPQELRAAREQLVGPEAANRLEALDRQRSAWTIKLQSYDAQSQALQTDATLSDTQRQQALAQLRHQLFTPQEQLRLQALRGTPN